MKKIATHEQISKAPWATANLFKQSEHLPLIWEVPTFKFHAIPKLEK